MTPLLFEEKVRVNRRAFTDKVRKIAASLNMNPNWLMAVMNFETGGTFSPSIRNPLSSATGLIQFMNLTARELGTTTEALARMSNVQQLDYVEKYFAMQIRRHGTIDNIAEAYLAVLYPAAISWPMDRVFPKNVYAVNKGFDLDKNQVITKDEVIKKITSTIPSAFMAAVLEKKTL